MVSTTNTNIIDSVSSYFAPQPFSVTVNTAQSYETVILPLGYKVPGRVNCVLKRSMPAQIEITRDGYVISSGFIDEESYGPTYKEALVDFLTSICDHLQSLTRIEKDLSTRDKTVLANLRSLIQI